MGNDQDWPRLGVVAEILAQCFPQEALRLALLGSVEEFAQCVDEGVAAQAAWSQGVGQQALRLRDQCILGAKSGFEFGSAVGHECCSPQ
jgi:hypothetical protein